MNSQKKNKIKTLKPINKQVKWRIKLLNTHITPHSSDVNTHIENTPVRWRNNNKKQQKKTYSTQRQ